MFYRALTEEQSVRVRRARPVIALALVAFVIGVVVGANSGGSTSDALAARFVAAWSRGDYAAMYEHVDPAIAAVADGRRLRRGYTPKRCARRPPRACARSASRARRPAGMCRSRSPSARGCSAGCDSTCGCTWSATPKAAKRSPGRRRSRSPACSRARRCRARPRCRARAKLLARDGSVLAEAQPERSRHAQLAARWRRKRGGRRSRPDPRLAPRRARSAGRARERDRRHERARARTRRAAARHARRRAARRPPRARRARCRAPRRRAHDRLARRPAGGGSRARLAARRRRRARALQRPDPRGRRDRPGQPCSRRARRSRWSRSRACSARTSRRRTTVFPYATYATLDGVKLSNANGEECGGTLELAFAVSCNSVFSPLGVKLGAARLVAMAERFGFNHETGDRGRGREHAARRGADPGRTGRRLDRDRPGPGAGEPLEMATRGREHRRRRPPAAARRSRPSRRRPAPHVTSAGVAHTVRRLMIESRAQGDRHGGGDPGRDGRRQDGHGRTEDRVQLLAGGESQSGEAKPIGIGLTAAPAPPNEAEQHRRLVRLLRAGARTRGSPSACCSSKTAPAATRRRRSPARCSKPALKASR